MTIAYQVVKKVIDEDKINKSIDSYEKSNGNCPQFLVMSMDTFNNFNEFFYSKSQDSLKDSYQTYRGIPVAICNYMGEGQVAIV